MLLTPLALDVYASAGDEPASLDNQFNNSVLTTGLLPQWVVMQDGQAMDVSGLRGEKQETPHKVKTWLGLNSDNMSFVYRIDYREEKTNSVVFQNEIVSPSDYFPELKKGFVSVCRIICNHRASWLGETGLLSMLHEIPIRYVFRPTCVYATIIRESLEPYFLRSGVRRSILLDVLSRPLLLTESRSMFWSIRRFEQLALERLDVPYFTAISHSNCLEDSMHVLAIICFRMSAYDNAHNRVLSVSEEQIDNQVLNMQAALATAVENGKATTLSESSGDNAEQYDGSCAELQPLLVEAEQIAAVLVTRSSGGSGTKMTWLGIEYNPLASTFLYSPIGFDLYNGASGIVLFLPHCLK